MTQVATRGAARRKRHDRIRLRLAGDRRRGRVSRSSAASTTSTRRSSTTRPADARRRLDAREGARGLQGDQVRGGRRRRPARRRAGQGRRRRARRLRSSRVPVPRADQVARRCRPRSRPRVLIGRSPRGTHRPNKLALEERVVQINRVAKVVKGGRRFSFSAVVVVGDGAGHVGVGLGKAGEVPESIRKGVEDAKKNLIRIPMVGTTIPHEVRSVYGASSVLLKPASQGTGVIAGGSVRAVLEAAGIRDILSKIHGSTNPVNVTRATIEALRSLHSAEELERPPRRQAGQPDRRPAGARRRRWPMAGKLKVTQVKSTISHIARNRATVRALGLHGIGSTSIVHRQRRDPRHGPPGPVPRDRRGDRRDARTPSRRGEGMKLHDLQPGRGLAQAAHARRPRHRRRQGQDRRPRHQGPEGSRRRLDPGLVRGRPDAAPHAHPEAARLQEPVQDRVRGRERRRHRRARRARRVRGRGSRARRRPGRPAPITVNQDILRAVGLVRTLDKPLKILGAGELSAPLFVVADAFTASARAKIEAAGGSVNVLEVPADAAGRARASTDRAPRPAASREPAAGRGRRRAEPAPAPSRAATAEAGRGRRAGRRAAEGREPAEGRPRPPTAADGRDDGRGRRPPRPTPSRDAEAAGDAERPRRPRPATPPTRPRRRPATTPDPCSNPCSTPSARRTSGAGSCIVLGTADRLPAPRLGADPGRSTRRSSQSSSRATRCSACSTCSPAAACRSFSVVGLGDEPVHQRLDHHAADDRRRARRSRRSAARASSAATRSTSTPAT